MMAKSNRVGPEILPPTKRGAHYHSLHVHFHVVNWVDLTNGNLEAKEWGWKLPQPRCIDSLSGNASPLARALADQNNDPVGRVNLSA